jgi:hypothetical protein
MESRPTLCWGINWFGEDALEVSMPMVQKWVEGVEKLAKAALRYHQSVYTGVINCL